MYLPWLHSKFVVVTIPVSNNSSCQNERIHRMQKSFLVPLLLLVAVMLAACPAAPAPAQPGAPAQEAATPVAAAEGVSCTDELGCVEIAPDDPVRIAYMFPLSGPVAFLGEDQRGAVEIAADDRGNTLLGRPLQLAGEDSMCSAEGGQAAAQRVASDTQVVGVIGTACSSAATAALPIISGAGLVMISASNTGPALTDPNGTWMPGYFRTAHNDLFQGRAAAEFAYNELGIRTAATIHDGSPYADGLQAVFADVFVELGGEITFQGAVNVGDTDMRPILTSIAPGSPGILYFPVFEPEGNFIADQSTEIPGLEDTILMGADGILVESFPRATGEAAVGMYLSGPYIDPIVGSYAEFLQKWDDKFGGTPPAGFHAHAYDAMNILMDAIESVAQESEDGTILIGRQALRDAIAATENYTGITGNLTCGEYGDCATGEALGIYLIGEDEVAGQSWPPEVIWTPGQ
jgi:branched-chain amino acid transport system substrate-binding protein